MSKKSKRFVELVPPVVVLDSNVFIAALLNSASCRDILTEWRNGAFDVAISHPLLRELRGVLKRPKFQNRFSQKDAAELLRFIEDTAVSVRPLRLRDRICRDSTDDKLFACAFAAGASRIVSGDKDVLSVAPIGGLVVCSPGTFLTWLKRTAG